MTSNDSTAADQWDRRHLLFLLRMAYGIGIAAALGFFAAFMVTHRGYWLMAAFAACLFAWVTTEPLDEARFQARVHARSES
jgi:hypothetical protein